MPHKFEREERRDRFNRLGLTKTWHIITGEYPPQSGGVSDYTELLANGLAASGCEVHVWCPTVDYDTPVHTEVVVHRFNKHFSPRNLIRLGKFLTDYPAPRLLLVQYAPNAFGMRGLNILFCFWLLWRKLIRKDDVRVMFHEPFFYFTWQRPQRNLLALVQRLMAMVLLAASRVVYISIPAWEKILERVAWLRRPPMIWLPIPSTIPLSEDRESVTAIRRKVTSDQSGKSIVGHFGTYGDNIKPELARIFIQLLRANTDVVGICLGTNSNKFVNEIICAHPELKSRLTALGSLSAKDVSHFLQACDLLLQPYPDGVSSRRTSVMAGLSHGLPIVTTTGVLSEPIWAETNCVVLVATNNNNNFVAAVQILLKDSFARTSLSSRASSVYSQYFALEQTLRTILDSG